MEASGKPYAICLGNHDIEADLTGTQVVDLDMRLGRRSLTRASPEGVAGAGNYWLPVMSTEDSSKEAARLWFLDSVHQSWRETARTGRHRNETQIAWLLGAAASSRGAPSMAFVHVPLPEYMTVWNRCDTVGGKHELVCSRNYHTNIFPAFKSAGISAVWCGHDHCNNYHGVLDGIRLGYGQKTGFDCYGPPAGWQRGARVIVLREGQAPRDAETYVRHEDGSLLLQPPSVKPWWTRLQYFGHG